jgi:hypothetical protein
MTRRVLTITVVRLVEERADADPIDTTGEALDDEVSQITQALRPLAKCGQLLSDDARRRAGSRR